MLNLLHNWRTALWLGFLVFLVVGSLIPQVGALLLAAWWTECQGVGMACWRVARRAVSDTRWRRHIRRIGHWLGCVAALGLVVWLVGYWVTQPRTSLWIWAVGVCVWHVVVCVQRRMASDSPETKVGISATDTASEIVVDLEPLLAEMGETSEGVGEGRTRREALEAQCERIRATCFSHPVSQALTEQVEREVKPVLKRVIEEALEEELNEHVGGVAYERGERVKGDERLRSGSWSRGVRTVCGEVKVRIPKLRRGNGKREWRVLRRYERSFGPWLDVQLHLYRLGLSQRDLQETLRLGFGQALSVKGIEHIIAVVEEELRAFRETRLQETPPVLIVDGVMVKVLLPTGIYRINQRGQRREEKRRKLQVILVAVGLWPDGRYEVLDYALVEQESKASWRQFLRRLLEKGLNGAQVDLVVGDGRAGLGRAIRAAFPSRVRYQRCVFHKLQNLADNLSYRDLVLDAGLSARQGRKQAKRARAEAILRDAARIYATADEKVIRERLVGFQQKWGVLEPKAVRCFLRDFSATLNYLRVPFPRKHLICTTNLADRFFREFRGRANEMGCFGSQAQAETLFYLVLQRDRAKRATR